MATPKIITVSSEANQPGAPTAKVTPRLRTLSSEANQPGAPVALVTPRLRSVSFGGSSSVPLTTPEVTSFFEEVQTDHPPATPLITSFFIEAQTGPILNKSAPADVVFGNLEATQVNGDPKNRTQVDLNFSTVVESQTSPGEHLGVASGAAESMFTAYPAILGVEVFEATGYSAGGGDTTLSAQVEVNDFLLPVTSPTNFSVNDWVEVKEGALQEFAQIEEINGSVLKTNHPLNAGTFTSSAMVKAVDVTTKTVTTDYAITALTGEVALVAGQFTASNGVVIRYRHTIDDLDGYEAYRIPGDEPLADGAHYSEVTGHGSVVTVDAAIASGATSVVDILAASLGGTTQTYFLFSRDTEGNFSRAQSAVIESITSLVQNLSKAVGVGEVTLSWDAITEANFDGVSIYRSVGSWDPPSAVKVNSVPITSSSFVDGPSNITTRRVSGQVPYPTSGQTYYYAVETEDTTSLWVTGTQNQSFDPLKTAVTTAVKTD